MWLNVEDQAFFDAEGRRKESQSRVPFDVVRPLLHKYYTVE